MNHSENKNHSVLSVPKEHWVGDGFCVRTLIHASPSLYSRTNPFILLDYASPKEFTPTTDRRGVGEHPHRGFETVTFAIQSEIEHRDSSGADGMSRT